MICIKLLHTTHLARMPFNGVNSILNRDVPSYLAAYPARVFQKATWMEESGDQLRGVPEMSHKI